MLPISRGLLRRSALPLALALFCAAAPAQSAEDSFAAAQEAFREGDEAAAIAHLKAVLAENPGNEQALELWNGAEQRLINEMLLSRGELGQLAERFLGLARAARKEFIEDPGNAEEVVARLLAGDELDRQRALLELRAGFGPWAVPALLGPMADRSDIDTRVLAIQALTRLGGDAVMPLVAALQSDDETTRRNAASVLGTLRDRRAAPALAFLARDAEDTTTSAIATEALAKLGLHAADAVGLARSTAEGWLRGDLELTQPYSAAAVLWTWNDGQLQGEAVLAGLYPLLAAEQVARLGTPHGALPELRPILASIHAAQKAEIQAAAHLAALEDNELLEAAVARLPRLDVELALAGSHRGQGLVNCLVGPRRHPQAAIALMDAMGSSMEERQALQAVLNDRSTGVAAAAALALARQGDTDPVVVATLATTLNAEPDRLVAVIGETGLSAGPGWQVVSGGSVAEALLRAKMLPPKDVLIVQDGAHGVTLDTLVFSLRNDPRTAETPLIVVTDDVDGVSALYEGKVELITDRATLADVEAVAQARDGSQQLQVDLARRAAEALHGLPVALVRAADGLIAQALEDSSDPGVLAALLRLAGRVSVVSSLPRVEALLLDEGSEGDVRLAALEAAARLWASGQRGVADTDELLERLSGWAHDEDDAALALAAAEALGQLSSQRAAPRPLSSAR